MSNFSLDVLQGYFDDLLTPSPQSTEAKLQWAEPDPVVQGDAHPAAAIVDELARQKLARLLASQPLAVESPLPVEPLRVDEPPLALPLAASEGSVMVDVAELAKAAGEAEVQPEVPAIDPHFGWQENGRPAWAQERFDVLLFEVAGLTLAVPLMCLGQIQPLTDELTPLFGQADWFMGLQPTAVGKIRTINTARFVMPERYQDHFVEAARYVISIAGLPWGLAVDAVNQPITLHPEDVRWRSERSKRPWLAGTVKQHMCALLDIQTMGQLLQQAEQTQSGTDPLKA